MSKRHQSSRRRTYGRRQHEVRERLHRNGAFGDELDRRDDFAELRSGDPLAHVDPRRPRTFVATPA